MHKSQAATPILNSLGQERPWPRGMDHPPLATPHPGGVKPDGLLPSMQHSRATSGLATGQLPQPSPEAISARPHHGAASTASCKALKLINLAQVLRCQE